MMVLLIILLIPLAVICELLKMTKRPGTNCYAPL